MKPPTLKSTYLFILPWSLRHVGGVNQVVINLAREALRAGNLNPIILIADWDSCRPVWEEIEGITTVRWRIRPFHSNMSLKERIAYIVWEKIFRYEFSRFCKQNRVSVLNVHYPGPVAFTLGRILEKISASTPFILSFHGSDLSTIASSSTEEISKWRQLLWRTHHVVVCSSDLGRKYSELFGNERIPQVIHNGLDVASFVAMSSAALHTKERVILNVAKFDEMKGQDVLIKAFAAISTEYKDVRLVLIGALGAALPALRAMCTSKGIGNCVEFFPDVPHHQIATFYQGATIFVLPSRVEAFGIVLLEAGAFKLPVVASSVGGIPEIISNGVDGRLVPPGDEVELEICLRSLLDQPEEARRLGIRLYQNVISNFTWTSAYNKYIDLIHSQTEARIVNN